jgi:predicted ribosomally synthesized peptide with nif11-like leader
MKKLAVKNPEVAENFETKHLHSPPFPILNLRLARRNFTRTESWVNLNCGGACEVLGITRKDAVKRSGVKFFAPERSSWEEVRNQGLMNRSLRYLLHYDHRLADYFGMEGKAPFLTMPMAELVSKLKLEFLYSGGMLKYPLRKIFPEIPKKVRFHTKKTGFWQNGPEMPNLLPKAFYEKLQQDEELAHKIKELKTPEASKEYIQDQLGYDFTLEEMHEIIFESNPELTDEELEAVVGGLSDDMMNGISI